MRVFFWGTPRLLQHYMGGHQNLLQYYMGGERSSQFITILLGRGALSGTQICITEYMDVPLGQNVCERQEIRIGHNIGAQKIADVLGRIINSNPKNPILIILCNTA